MLWKATALKWPSGQWRTVAHTTNTREVLSALLSQGVCVDVTPFGDDRENLPEEFVHTIYIAKSPPSVRDGLAHVASANK